MDFQGQAVFSSGTSSTGLNFGIVSLMASLGAAVTLTGRREGELAKRIAALVARGVPRERLLGVKMDVRDEASVQRAVSLHMQEFGRIDVVVNGAAGNFLCLSDDLSVNALRTVVEIDTIGAFAVAKACLEALKASRGVILNISATLHYTQTPFQMHASVAKAGLDAMTRHLAVEWGSAHGIRVVGIAPGAIENTEGASRLSAGLGPAQFGAQIPLRLGKIQDIANAAVFLCSDMASNITGQTLVVDGGSALYTPPFVSNEQYQRVRKARM